MIFLLGVRAADKGDGKGDDKQNPMCASMAGSVCSRCVYVHVAV